MQSSQVAQSTQSTQSTQVTQDTDLTDLKDLKDLTKGEILPYRVLLAHDAEIDDICALVNYPRIDLELICSDAAKFSGVALEGKSRLYKALTSRELSSIPALMTDGVGKPLHETEVETFTRLISEFFENCGMCKVFVVLTGQCAPIFGILHSLLSINRIKSDSFEIIWINGRHNGLGCSKHLRKLASFNLIIREFNSYSSLGEGMLKFVNTNQKKEILPVKLLSTGHEFSQQIDPNSVMADYARKFNYSLLAEAPSKIKILAAKYPQLHEIADKIEKLINKGDDLGLKPKRCAKLANLFIIVVNLLCKSGYFVASTYLGPKIGILQNNLIQFPLHDLAAVVILNELLGDKTGLLTPQMGYAEYSNNFVEIQPLQQNLQKTQKNNNLLRIIHYIAIDPEKTRKYLENIVMKIKI